jgi:hypothetical protein
MAFTGGCKASLSWVLAAEIPTQISRPARYLPDRQLIRAARRVVDCRCIAFPRNERGFSLRCR